MAEEHLDVPDVRPALEEMRRGRVPQRVTCDVLSELRRLRRLLDDVVHERGVQSTAALGQEQPGHFGCAFDVRPSLVEVDLDRFRGGVRERDVAILGALAQDNAEDAVFRVDVFDLEFRELAGADARAVEEFEDGAIAQAQRGIIRDGFDELLGIRLRENPTRQALRLARILHRGRGIREHVPTLPQETKQRLHRRELLDLIRDRVGRAVLLRRAYRWTLIRLNVGRADVEESDATRTQPRGEDAS